MAETRDSRGKEPAIRKQDPSFSHSPDEGEAMPAGVQYPTARYKKGWYQKNQNIVVSVAVGTGLLLLLLLLAWLLGWLGSGGTTPPPVAMPPVAASQPAATAPAPAPSPVQQAAPIAPATQPPISPPDAKIDDAKKEQKPPLPDDVTKWKKDEYYRARHENDPKLLQAIVYLGTKFPGKSSAAKGLTDLLKPLPPEKPLVSGTSSGIPGGTPGVPAAQPKNPADLTKLVETIIEALGCNGSESARGTLEQVLAGTFVTDDDKMAVEATLKTLAAHPSDGNDALLLRVVTAAEELRPIDRRGPWTANDLQAKAFELVKQSASSELRTKLAGTMVGTPARLDPKDPINEFLLAANPLNCGAQLMLYKKANLSKELKATLVQQFVGYSSKAMSSYLGIPDESQPGVGVSPSDESAKAAEAALGPRLAGQLWSDEFRALLESKLDITRPLDKQQQLVLLAATIPQDSSRALLAKILRGKRWYDGPKELESAGLTDRVVTDPGLLVLIKMSPRKESPTTPRALDVLSPRPGRGAPSGASGNEMLRKKLQAEQDWMDVSAKLVSAWCKRFDAVASAKAISTSKPGGDDKDKLPSGFELAPGARIVASHHIVLPDAAPAGFNKVASDALEVYYVRAEETNKLKKAIGHYKLQAKGTDLRMIGNKIWIDSLRCGSQKGWKRSIDVLITRPEGGIASATEKNEEEVDLTIEILVIETKDTTKDTDAVKDTTKAPAKE